ncbi:unnamed protein product [Paramecium pentaurelia]|uniref:RING-type domain-containing protein n=1 Tax=Paramecium pentaurelia TaxID=43138 RepID=A0A8S1YFL5_9CILI|nr:unnamed protein product [Paramecium pentaurelia]
MNQQQSQSSTHRRNNSDLSIDAQPPIVGLPQQELFQLGSFDSYIVQLFLDIVTFILCIQFELQDSNSVYQHRTLIIFDKDLHQLQQNSKKQLGMLYRVDVGCWINFLLCMFDQQDQSCLIYFIDNNDFQMQYLAIFLVFMTIIWMIQCIFQIYRHNTNDYQQKLIVIMIRFCFVTQLMFINLKVINWLPVRWIYTFSIFWLFLLIIILMQLVSLFKLSIIINQYFNCNIDQRQLLMIKIIGIIWTNLIIFGFCGVPTYALLKLSFYLEQNIEHNYVFEIITSVFYTLIFLVYTIYHKDLLSTFIFTILKLQTQQEIVREQEIISFPSSRNQKKFVYQFRDNILNDFPKQLIKISSTYYLPEDQRNQTEINSAGGIYNKSPTLTEVVDGSMKQCFNCFQQQSNTVYIPCGHGGVCSKCAFDWFKERKECLICRSQIQAILKIVQADDQRVKVIDIIALN